MFRFDTNHETFRFNEYTDMDEAEFAEFMENCNQRKLYTDEGNSGDSCRQRSYPLGYYQILGYGTPAY